MLNDDHVPMQQRTPHLTVIVPAYNSEGTIDACLSAIRQSTYRDYELIVVDDGSRDRTAQIAQQYADTVVRQSNRGSAEARNGGIRASRGDIIVNIDSDVVVRPDTLTLIRDFLDDRPDIDAVTGLLAEEHPHPGFFTQYKNLYMHYVFNQLPESVTFLYGSAHALRKECAHLFYDGSIGRADDTELGQKLVSRGKTIALFKRLEVVHLKRYDWLSLAKNDFWIPFDWAWIFVRYQGWKQLGRKGTGYGHARAGQLASVIVAPAIVFVSALSLNTYSHFAYAVPGAAVWLLLNWPFIKYLARVKGLNFGVASIAVTFLDHIVMAAGIAAGVTTAGSAMLIKATRNVFGNRLLMP
jgi:glycosyltransferase involved in cell wall biosynthesis